MRRGSRESDQNKRPLRLRIAVLIGGAGFSCRIGGKEWRVKVVRKDESRFTIKFISRVSTGLSLSRAKKAAISYNVYKVRDQAHAMYSMSCCDMTNMCRLHLSRASNASKSSIKSFFTFWVNFSS